MLTKYNLDQYVNALIDNMFPKISTTSLSLVAQHTFDNQGDYLRVELPGFDAKEVSVTVEGNLLKVAAHQEKSEKDKFSSKRDFSKSWTLGPDCDVSKISSEMKNGLLTVTVPLKEMVVKQPETSVKTIPVKSV